MTMLRKPCHFTRANRREALEEVWDEGLEILESVAWRRHNDYCETGVQTPSLRNQMAIDRHKDIEASCGKRQQFTVASTRPPRFRYGDDAVPRDGAFQPSRQALVKQHPHAHAVSA